MLILPEIHSTGCFPSNWLGMSILTVWRHRGLLYSFWEEISMFLSKPLPSGWLTMWTFESCSKQNSLKSLRVFQDLVFPQPPRYLRPLPLISLLEHRPPVGYVWGYFDFFSPVPREEGQAFYNSDAWKAKHLEIRVPHRNGEGGYQKLMVHKVYL